MALTQPKKPAGGGFGFFSNEKRAEFMKACKGQPITVVSKMAGEKWKLLSEKEKEPYQKKYELAKQTFEKDMAAFLAAGGVKEKGAAALRTEKRKAKEGKLKNKKKKKKDPNAPKKPAGGGYGVFMAETPEKIVKSRARGHKITDVSKAAGQQWKSLSEAANKLVEYIEAMEEYKKTHGADAGDEDDKKKARKAGA